MHVAAGLSVREWVLVGGREPAYKGGAWKGILVFSWVWCVHACVLRVGVHLSVRVCRKPGSPGLDFSPCSQEMPVAYSQSVPFALQRGLRQAFVSSSSHSPDYVDFLCGNQKECVCKSPTETD